MNASEVSAMLAYTRLAQLRLAQGLKAGTNSKHGYVQL